MTAPDEGAEPQFGIELSLLRSGFALEVALQLPLRGTTVLFGPSGSGKTTLLRCVAGLEQAAGRVWLGDELWQDSRRGVFKPTWQRELGYVFQEASLFEHLDVRGNLRYGLSRTRGADGQGLEAAIELLGIAGLLKRAPASLSGGERQRVAIARALATQPRLLLLDEPLASLDLARRREVLPWIERLRGQLQVPMLYVTHAAEEMARLADHLVLLEQGRVHTSAPLAQALARTQVASAFGEEAGMVVPGVVSALDRDEHMARIQIEGATVLARDSGLSLAQQVRVRILARDVSLALSDHADSTIQNRLRGVIEVIEADIHPSQALVRVRCGHTLLMSRVTRRSLATLSLAPGASVWCQVKSVALML